MHRINLEERRRKIAQIAAEMIARDGGDAATVRQIAAKAGSSTTFITKYFADKRELLLSAYQYSSTSALARFEQQPAGQPADLIDRLVSLTAIDEETKGGWRVHIAFWEKAVRDPVLAAEMRHWTKDFRTRIEGAIRAAYGESSDIGRAAQLAIAVIHGISLELIFEPESWSREQIRKVLSQQLETALGRPPNGS